MDVTGDAGQLVLASHGAKGPVEDAAEISLLQAEALLELTAGRIEYLGIPIAIDSHPATIQRFLIPGPLDLISMAFKHDKAAGTFQPPAWFGPEVSADPSYRLRAIALGDLPSCRRWRSRMQPSTACSTSWITGIRRLNRTRHGRLGCRLHPGSPSMPRTNRNSTGSPLRTA